ncbi:hypothetical protein M948_14395 [Virgibacillus sp. CM-4]|nr:hypothetical protein M948_14395 [Virgibacillus sp. CM-4]
MGNRGETSEDDQPVIGIQIREICKTAVRKKAVVLINTFNDNSL